MKQQVLYIMSVCVCVCVYVSVCGVCGVCVCVCVCVVCVYVCVCVCVCVCVVGVWRHVEFLKKRDFIDKFDDNSAREILHAMPSSSCEFRDDLFSESQLVLQGAKKICPIFYFPSGLGKNSVWMYTKI